MKRIFTFISLMFFAFSIAEAQQNITESLIVELDDEEV